MALATTHRFSRQDYHRMGETGVLGPTARVELLNGEIIDMSPIGSNHGGVVNRLNGIMAGTARGRFCVSVQNPLVLDDHSEPEPDLMLLRPVEHDYIAHHPRPEDVLLLIEVADSSIQYDREEKLPAYGRAGVPEVWIVNLTTREIEVHREPHFNGYGSISKLQPGDGQMVAVPGFPDVVVELEKLFHVGS